MILLYLFLFLCTAIPPPLSQPYLIGKGSTWAQIGWHALDCDGGYQINGYQVNAYDVLQRTSTSYTTVGGVSNLSYIFHNLNPNTEYYFSVQGLSPISLTSSYSRRISVITYPVGMEVHVTGLSALWTIIPCSPFAWAFKGAARAVYAIPPCGEGNIAL